MDVYIADDDFNVIALVDYAKSVIVCTRYCALDDCELYVPCSRELLEALKIGNIIIIPGRENVMVIESLQITTEEEQGDFIIAKAYGAETYIRRRIVWGQTNLAGTPIECIDKLLCDNLIAPRQQDRRIEHIAIGRHCPCSAQMEKQITGDNLLDAITGILTTYGLGYKMVYDDGRNIISFCIINGTNCSISQYDNPTVEFSGEFDNLLSTEYTANSTEYKNVALVAGEGEGADRRITEVGTAAGAYRYEAFVDAREISSQTEEGTLPHWQYNGLLAEKGSEALKEYEIEETFGGEVDSNGAYRYLEDYNVGDIVTITNRYGIRANKRITEVLESWSEEGYKCILTFG